MSLGSEETEESEESFVFESTRAKENNFNFEKENLSKPVSDQGLFTPIPDKKNLQRKRMRTPSYWF